MIDRIKEMIKPPIPCYNYKRPLFKHLDRRFQLPGVKILDLGSGGRRLLPQIITVDLDKNIDVDVISNASALPFHPDTFDLIISTAVLEHVPEINLAVSEIFRCCKPGGQVYIEIPFLQTYHAHPHDYRRLTLPGLERTFRHFEKIESGVCVGPFSVLAWYMRKLPRYLVGEGKVGLVLELFAGWMTFWIKYLDVFIPGAKRAHQAASGLYFLGKKKYQ